MNAIHKAKTIAEVQEALYGIRRILAVGFDNSFILIKPNKRLSHRNLFDVRLKDKMYKAYWSN